MNGIVLMLVAAVVLGFAATLLYGRLSTSGALTLLALTPCPLHGGWQELPPASCLHRVLPPVQLHLRAGPVTRTIVAMVGPAAQTSPGSLTGGIFFGAVHDFGASTLP